LITLTIATIIWLSQVIKFIGYVTEEGASLSLFLYITTLLLPSLLLIVTPIALVVSVLIVYNKMIMNNEIAILRSTGVNKFSLVKPAIIMALLTSLFCYSISFYFMPLSSRTHREIKEYVKNNYASILLSSGSFKNLKQLTMYASEKDSDGNMKGVVLFDGKNPGEPLMVLAKEGKILSNDTGILLHLKEGVLQKNSLKLRPNVPAMLYFDEYDISLTSYSKTASEVKFKPGDRYINELFNYKNLNDTKYTLERLKKELHYRLTFPLMPIMLTLIGASAILYGGFNRRGQGNNIRNAILLSIGFFSVAMYLYEAMETFPSLTYLLYFYFVVVLWISIHFIKDTKQIG
jgi:lipopolysaccharide export system permease protein